MTGTCSIVVVLNTAPFPKLPKTTANGSGRRMSGRWYTTKCLNLRLGRAETVSPKRGLKSEPPTIERILESPSFEENYTIYNNSYEYIFLNRLSS
jgi:hypothetical protein